jgi:hypothetical protein
VNAWRRSARRWAGLLALPLAAAAQDLKPAPALAPLAGPGPTPPAPWRAVGLPGMKKPPTRFEVVTLDGQRVLRIESERSYGNLVHVLPADEPHGQVLSWRWRVDQRLPRADLRERQTEDVPVRVCAAFDEPLNAVPFVERQLLRAMRLRSSEAVPAAAVCYVWDHRLAAGATLHSPFTHRIRYLVLRGPESPLQAWRSERRDLQADFLALFGDEVKTVPPLLSISVGADADNTQDHGIAHLSDLTLE